MPKTALNKNLHKAKNAYEPWNSLDDEIILRMYQCKIPKPKIACFFGRSIGAINSRIKKLTENSNL